MIEQINEQIIDALQSEKIPWRSSVGYPRFAGQPVDGLNAIVMMMAAEEGGCNSCQWGNAMPASHTKVALYPYGYVTYNQECGENHKPDWDFVHKVIANTKVKVRYTDKTIAMYHFPEGGDYIEMCKKERFDRGPGGPDAYYQVIFHELGHWTQPKQRLNWWKDDDMVVNELGAEMVSGFMTSWLNIKRNRSRL
jgi:antirestriction protein ArdC